MRRFAVFLILITLFAETGCKRLLFRKKQAPSPTPAPAAATPAPTPEATPTPTPVATVEANKDALVIVLCYHRFEDRPRDSLALKPSDFEAQMQTLKDNGISVIGMQDFLAWRRGEKSIPAKSAIITIDDGYISGYTVAWPILKKYGYPFTMFIYTDYVKGGPRSGGQSMSWEQLAEMRDAGVDIGSHTVSHTDLRSKHGKSPEEYAAWVTTELNQSKEIIENNLGIQVKTLAYPYGLYNQTVRELAAKAGYEALFTVYGQRIPWSSPSDIIGRYAIESSKPEIFQAGVSFSGSTATGGSATTTQLAVASMITEPLDGATVTDPKPVIKANLATMGKLDPASVEMRISGFGLVPAQFDPETSMITYQITRKLQPRDYTIIISGKVEGKKVETRWSFKFSE